MADRTPTETSELVDELNRQARKDGEPFYAECADRLAELQAEVESERTANGRLTLELAEKHAALAHAARERDELRRRIEQAPRQLGLSGGEARYCLAVVELTPAELERKP